MSELKPIKWSSVVVGKWNPAILSPKGIATKIFKKSPDDPFEVMVPLDAQGPPLIKIEGLTVTVDFERLIIDCEDSGWESIEKARKYCCDAIEWLPITPLTAAGFNIRYELIEPEDDFRESLVLPFDNKISEQELEIDGRSIRRSIKWKDGTINLEISKIKHNIYSILLNFDKKSADRNELKDWLGLKIADVKGIVTTFLCEILSICNKGEI